MGSAARMAAGLFWCIIEVAQTEIISTVLERRESSLRRMSPRLTTRGLSHLLALMCLVPVVTIVGLWLYLSLVYEGKLECRVTPMGLPSADIYRLPYRQREAVPGSSILVLNDSDDTWTHINIVINTYYQIYDIDPLYAGQQREYLLDRFVSRTGARFETRYNPLKSVRVYARRPAGDRATYFAEFSNAPR